jgi:predicted aspartyl protease
MTAFTRGPQSQSKCFTVRFSQRASVLHTDVDIFPAFQLSEGGHVPQGQKKKTYKAVYDTGATQTAISPTVVNDFGLPSVGAAQVKTAGGGVTTSTHIINLALPNGVMFQMMRVTKADLGEPFDVLIGMDILGTGDFAVTHHLDKTTFSFRWPSQDEIDFVAEAQAKPEPARSDKIGRNSQCPCGSGKKYKKCCGI